MLHVSCDDSIGRRLRRLELESRILKTVLGLLAVVTCAVALMGQAPIESGKDAECIAIRDSEGRVRVEIGIDPGGDPYVALLDVNGVARARLDADTSGPGLHFRSDDGSTVASFRIMRDGEPFLIMCAEDGSVRFRAP